MFLFCFLLSQSLLAQNTRFIYEYKSIKDSTKRFDISREDFYLDTTKSGSVFYSYSKFKEDSAASTNHYSNVNISDKVFKTYPNYKISLVKKVDGDLFQFSDDRKIKWNILSDIKLINSWKTQKATADFAGRKWTAWFSAEIPVNDGPYKFRGLPGLIIEIEDESRSHIFSLKSITKIGNAELYSGHNLSKPINITRDQFIKAFKAYRSDPMKSWIQKGVVKGENDLTPDTDFLKRMSDVKKGQVLRDNNILEIDLLE